MMARRLTDILTKRDMFFVDLLAQGFSNKEIAARAGVSPGYIRQRVSLAYLKLGLARCNGSSLEPRIVLAQRYDRECR